MEGIVRKTMEKTPETGTKVIAENLAGLLRKATGLEIAISKHYERGSCLLDIYGLTVPQPKGGFTKDSRVEYNELRFRPESAFIIVGKEEGALNPLVIEVHSHRLPERKKMVFFNRITMWRSIWKEIDPILREVVKADKDKQIKVERVLYEYGCDADRD